ncbi:hypothetical protein NCCP2716_22160 [Sporosarcina sp. NCCP-2716]|uniref:YibE/F family protein n=1 Tax=Sporosarcina sp. NCCP-2716 TaxID=2943679 RepID=UPI00203FBD8F|nr:YibE/F family protein [Sporosarcina sp. NCCP-2716]GKV69718.1 hypothetical protein NCCP2716_22160 [Sporosarcina sp. NCCP-2716]
MNVIMVLAAILFVLMALVGGSKGVRSFFALFLNFGVLVFMLFFMTNPDVNPVIVTFFASILVCCIGLFFINDVNSKTVIAFVSTMIVISVLLFFIVKLSDGMMIQGFGEEETESLSGLSLYVGVDFVKVGASVVIISTIGAILDVAISITSSMQEMHRRNPRLQRDELAAAGMDVGRDILGTDTNTLFFAFFGGYLALLIWFKDLHYSVGEIINAKVFSSEVLLVFSAGIGVALVIPVASWLSAAYLVRKRAS